MQSVIKMNYLLTCNQGLLTMFNMINITRIIFPFLIFFITLSLNAQEKPNHSSNKESTHLKFHPTQANEFKPHMLSHIYEGCPDNSECSKQMGAIRKKWLSVVSNKKIRTNKYISSLKYFKKTHGVPVTFWYIPKKILAPEIIFWHSPCRNHNTKTTSIRIAETLAPSFQSLVKLKKKGEKIIIPKTFTLNQKNQIQSFYYPRGDLPIMIDNNKLYFVREEEGHYYSMTVNLKGKIDIIKPFKPKNFPNEVKCPKPLLDSITKDAPEINLYQSYFCKELWNKSQRRFQIFAFGWSCN